MKKRSKIAALMVFALIVCLMGGCGKTAKGILEESQENGKKVESFKGKVNMDMALSVAQNGVSMKVDMKADMDMEMTQDAVHMNGKLDIGILGLSMDLELYMQMGDEEAIAYMKAANEWTKVSIPKDELKIEDMQDKLLQANKTFYGDLDEKDLVLQKDTEEYNGKDVYVITTTVQGDAIEKIMEAAKDVAEKDMQSPELAEVYDGLDFSKVKIDVESKIYKEDKLPAVLTMDWAEGLDELFASAMGDAATELELKSEKFTITVSYDEFDTVDKIEIPQEALDAQEAGQENMTDSLLDGIGGTTEGSLLDDGEDGEDPLSDGEDLLADGDEDAANPEDEAPKADADGYYTLISWDEEQQVKIKAPEGLEQDEYSSSDYMNFSLYGDDTSESVTFSLEKAEESSISSNEKYFEDKKEYYEESESITDFKPIEKKELKVGDRKVEYVSCSYMLIEMPSQEARAWMTLDNGYMVECDLSIAAREEGSLPDMEALIKSAFQDIKEEAA